MTKMDPRKARIRRHYRVRLRVKGTAERPRLCVYRSLNHIYAQVIDDRKGHTLAAASTLDPELKTGTNGKNKTGSAEAVGQLLAQKAIGQGVKKVTFDRGGFQYHGRVKALAEGARKGGLEF